MTAEILALIERFIHWLFYPVTSTDHTSEITLSTLETPKVSPLEVPVPSSSLLWDTPMNVRHSIRVICDDVGLTLEQKNTMCATIGGESEYDTKAVGPNYINKKDGTRVLASTDWGLCQWNDYYHGQEISGGYDGEAMNNPEKAVRLMCHYWKMGEVYRVWWIAYKSGRYLHFM